MYILNAHFIDNIFGLHWFNFDVTPLQDEQHVFVFWTLSMPYKLSATLTRGILLINVYSGLQVWSKYKASMKFQRYTNFSLDYELASQLWTFIHTDEYSFVGLQVVHVRVTTL